MEDRFIKVGDFVKLRIGGVIGKVEFLDKKKVVVWVGDFKMMIKFWDF